MVLDIEKLSEEVGTLLRVKGETLSTAESCTAGRIAAAITALPGSSVYFKGSVVSYCNEIKNKLLGVPIELLDAKGAVSQEVVCAMLEGVLRIMDTDYAIAITGFAGPSGGVEAPVGTIWIAVGGKYDIKSKVVHLGKSREENLSIGVFESLQFLSEFLKKT